MFFTPLAIASEKAMAPHSSTLAWQIPWMEEPCRLQSMGLRRAGHDWGTSLSLSPFMHWRRKWQPTPVFLPGGSQGRGSLVGCRLWGRTESVGNDWSDLAAAAAAIAWPTTWPMAQVRSVQSFSRVQLFATPWPAAHQVSRSITNLLRLKLISIESVMPSYHLILCRP